MNRMLGMAVIAGLMFSGTVSAASVSGSANVDLGNANVEIVVGPEGGGTSGQPDRPAHQGSGNVAIPPGHMPPPGQCRVWYHGREPGQQPPPGDCRKLRGHVPPGASLIRG